MAFPTESPPTITGRGGVAIEFYIPDPDLPDDVQSGKLSVQVKLSDDSIRNKQYNLLERLGDDAAGGTHLVALVALRDYILTRIAAEILA